MAATREEARVRGDVYFFTGQPCKRGHIAARYVSSPVCVDCARGNYHKRRPKTLAELKARYQANPEQYRKKERDWANANPHGYWAKNTIKNARIRATEAKVPFSITKDYLLSIITDKCPVFGTPFVFAGNGKVCRESATLDRLVPSEGYVEGNVVVISQFANSIKHSATSEDVARVVEWMRQRGI